MKQSGTRARTEYLGTASLPLTLTRFVGREQELAQAANVLAGARLLTLRGPGGSGKTRLALELVASVADRFRHGVRWVDLAAVSDPALVPQTAAAALDLREIPGRTILESLTAFLKNKEILLVFDNAEHLLPGCAALARSLLTTCPGLKILVTSREPLHLDGEAVLRVPPLALPPPGTVLQAVSLAHFDAIRLFTDRAALVQSAFRLSDENAPTVVRICSRLDGLPLAIELAAARVSVLALDQILQRLDDRFTLLGSPGRSGGLSRHQTLRAAIDWSYDLLPEHERALLRRLVVFAGGLDLEAAEAVCAFDEIERDEVLNLLSALVDKSVLVADTTGGPHARYHLLETIREYLSERLAPEEAPQARDRHLDYYLELAERAEGELKGRGQMEWLARLDAELDNFRSALSWALSTGQTDKGLRLASALGRFWEVRGYLSEGHRLMLDLLAAQGPLVSGSEEAVRRRIKALDTAGYLVYLKRDLPGAVEWFEKGLRLARTIEDGWWIALLLTSLGTVHIFDGTLAAQRPVLEQAVAAARTTGDPWLLSLCLTNLAHSIRIVDYQAALPLIEESIRLARQTGDRMLLGETLFVGTNAASGSGDILRAEPWGKEYLEVSRSIGSRLATPMALYMLAAVGVVAGRPHGQVPRAREGLTLAAEMGEPTLIALGLTAVGVLSAELGHATEMAELFGASKSVLETVGIDLERWAAPGTSLGPTIRGHLSQSRSQLRDAAYVEAMNRGRSLSVEQAVARALELADELEVIDRQMARAGEGGAPGPVGGNREPELTLQALGPVQVIVEGRKLTSADWVYNKAEELLFYLLCHGERTREQIGVDLYPDASPGQLRNNLGVVLHHLRRALGGPEWVLFQNGRYSFNRTLAPRYRFDVEHFEYDLRRAQEQAELAPASAIDHLRTAVGLYRGDLLEDLDAGAWHIARREELRREFLDGLVRLGGLLFGRGEFDQAADAYRRAIQSDAYLEAAHRGLMSCYARQSEPALALRHYRMLVNLLNDELGAEPSPETTALFERLRRGEQI